MLNRRFQSELLWGESGGERHWMPTRDFSSSSGANTQPLINQLTANSATGAARAPANLDKASSNLDDASGYFSGLLKGTPANRMAAVAPEVNSITAQYDTAKKNIANNSPRGGGAVLAGNAADIAKAGGIGNLLASVRPAAANALTSIGALFGNLGTAELSNSTSAAGAGANAGLALGGQNNAILGSIGQGVGTLLTADLGIGSTGSVAGNIGSGLSDMSGG